MVNGRMTNEAFKAKVITHLEYIKEKQDSQEKKLAEINQKLDGQRIKCDSRFQNIEKDVDSTKGWIKGAFAVIGTVVVGFIGIITKLFGGN